MSSAKKNNRSKGGKRSKKDTLLPAHLNAANCYCLKEVAAMFRRTERTVRNWRNAGKLTGYNHERYVLFEKALIDAAVEVYKRLGFLPQDGQFFLPVF